MCRPVLFAIPAALSAWALLLLFYASMRSPVFLIFFAGCFLLYRNTRAEHFNVTNLLALVYTFLILLAEHKRMTAPFGNKLFQALTILIFCAGMYLLLARVLQYAVAALMRDNAGEEESSSGDRGMQQTGNRRSLPGWLAWCFAHPGIMTFTLCVLCWMPYYLFEFPGICSPDSIVQLEQAAGLEPYSNHHPIAHTYILSLFYRFGVQALGSVNAGVGLYTAAQMLFLAAGCGYLNATIARIVNRHKGVVTCLTAAFFALMPFNGVFAVAVWKDIPFTAILMLLTSLLAREVYGICTLPPFIRVAVCYLLVTATGIFRSNGYYMLLLLIPATLCYLLVRRKAKDTARHRYTMAAACVCALITTEIFRGPVLDHAQVARPDFIESLCVPLQQVSRVLVNDYIIEAKDRAMIEEVMDLTYIRAIYEEGFADNMKELVRAGNQGYLVANKGRFLSLWLRLGLRYPGTYLEAWAALTKGYWYPDVAYHTAWIDGVIDNIVGVYHEPLIGGKVVIKLKELALKTGEFVPGLGLLYSMGSYTWLLLLAAALLWKKAAGVPTGAWLILAIPSALLVTLFLATPTATEFRYAYPVVMTSPLFLTVALK